MSNAKMTRRTLLCFTMLLLSFFASISSVAQDTSTADASLFLVIDGALYTWTEEDEAPQPYTQCSFDDYVISSASLLSFSPDGTRLALRLWTAETAALAKFADAEELWICDLTTREVFQLVSLEEDTAGSRIGDTSTPSWSPDGSRIIWGEVYYTPQGQELLRLRIHNFSIGQTTLLPAEDLLPDVSCGQALRPVTPYWGSTGVAVQYIVGGYCVSIEQGRGLRVYNLDGTLHTDALLEQERIAQLHWVDDGGVEKLAYTNDLVSETYLLDPATGNVEAVDATIAYVAVRAEDASLMLMQQRDTNADQQRDTNADQQYLRWLIMVADNTAPTTDILVDADVFTRFSDIAIAPDGTRAIFNVRGGPYLWDEGELAAINIYDAFSEQVSISAMAWSPLRAQLIANTAIGESGCSATLLTQFSLESSDVPEEARVITGQGDNNLRDAPSTAGDILTTLAEGSEFQVMSGLAVCHENAVWRWVMREDVAGWTAEAQGSTYFVEPIEE